MVTSNENQISAGSSDADNVEKICRHESPQGINTPAGNNVHVVNQVNINSHSLGNFESSSNGTHCCNNACQTPISDFYKNSTILITGGTGFVGKVLIQKLLRSFDVQKIYMLIRCKNNMTVEQRLEEFLNESIFDGIRNENSLALKKVHPVRANFNALDLDIDPNERSMLCNEVSIVFNVVASVKFNEKIGDAIDINVLGTKKILDLAMEMKNLKSFVHISTLYCNCNLKSIEEKMSRIFDDETLEKFRTCLVGEMPNTYTMTKKCAENLVNHRAFYLPAGIFRPPIEPMPGWTDNLYGPSGLCTWTARGLVRCIYGNSKCKANMVPADYCVNAMIASAWDVARRYNQCSKDSKEQREIPVYNYIFDKNNLTWGQYVKAYSKITKIIYMMSWFGLKEWIFCNQNIVSLDALMSEEEKKILQFNTNTINWHEYFCSYLSGIRKYFFKDNETNLQKRKIFYRRLLFVHKLLKTTFGFAFI
ncbi:hypothetical protein DOY81_006856, partial [Sarcophaga bullata]